MWYTSSVDPQVREDPLRSYFQQNSLGIKEKFVKDPKRQSSSIGTRRNIQEPSQFFSSEWRRVLPDSCSSPPANKSPASEPAGQSECIQAEPHDIDELVLPQTSHKLTDLVDSDRPNV